MDCLEVGVEAGISMPNTPSETSSFEEESPENSLPLYDLLSMVLQDFDAAVGRTDGWGWSDINVAIELRNASARLLHWKASIEQLAVEFCNRSRERDIKDIDGELAVRKLFTELEEERPYLSGFIRMFLNETRGVLINLKEMQTESQDMATYVHGMSSVGDVIDHM